jgi:hypothetical protein
MNVHQFPLNPLVLAPFQLKEALRCIFHTIIFNRALGPVDPCVVTSELFDVSFVKCGGTESAESDTAVEIALNRVSATLRARATGEKSGKGGGGRRKSSSFSRSVSDAASPLSSSSGAAAPAAAPKTTNVTLSFFESRRRSSFFGMTSAEEKVYWEQWILPVTVRTTSRVAGLDFEEALEQRRREAEVALEQLLAQILGLVNTKHDHIPPLRSKASRSPMPFKFEIAIPLKDEASESWLSRMLQTGPPMLT